MKFEVGDKVRINNKATLQYDTIFTRGQVVRISLIRNGRYEVEGEVFFESELSELTKLEKVMK